MTDAELRALMAEVSAAERAFDNNPQYGGSIVTELCAEVLRLRGLFAKYMEHVGHSEGSVFIPWEADGFTADEITALKEIDATLFVKD